MSTFTLIAVLLLSALIDTTRSTTSAGSTACTVSTNAEDQFVAGCATPLTSTCTLYQTGPSANGAGRHCATPKAGLTAVTTAAIADNAANTDDTFTGQISSATSTPCSADTASTFALGCTQPLTSATNCVLWKAGATGRHCVTPVTGYYANTLPSTSDTTGATDDSMTKCDTTCATCIKSTADKCTTCASGKYSVAGLTPTTGGTCAGSCDKSCASCLDATAAKCTTCASNYYGTPTATGGTCTACPSSCATCSSTGVCTSCATGYTGTVSVASPGVCTFAQKLSTGIALVLAFVFAAAF